VAFSSVAEAHQQIVDQCVESDEALMETYLAQGHLTPEQLHDAFEAALRQAHIVPVCFVSAKEDIGIDELMHVIANLAPSPLEGNPRPFLHQEGEDLHDEAWFPKPDAALTPVAHVFKVATDQFVGKLSMLKVHQGTFSSSTALYLDGVKKPVKLAHILRVNGKKQDEIPEAVPGDIVAVAKIEELGFDSVLHGQDIDHLRLKPLDMPRPMYGLAILPKNRGDERKFSSALQKILQEDPTVALERGGATGELVLRTIGELHMRIVLEKLQNRFNIEVETSPPKIAYRETIRGKAEGHHRHKKQTGGAGQFGEVYLRVEPLEGEDADLEFVDETVGGSVPKQFMPAIEKGIRKAMNEGALAGYPIHGVRVAVYDGKHHSVDSKEVAFVAAGRKAFLDAVKKANPAILEPIVDVEITAPSGALGDINGLIATKRGQVKTSEYLPGDLAIIYARAPLGEMSAFSGELKSITHGQGTFVLDYSHYEPAPAQVQQELQAAFKPEAEED
jgi:elongation factor G